MRRPAAALRKESDSESELEIDTRVWRLRRGADLVQAWKRPPSKIELQELAAAARKLSKGACSYWIPAFAQPTTPVQRFALDVFHFHCRRLGWTPKRLKALGKNAGAEVWAQRRSGKERQERRGMNWHFDKDEDLLDDCELVVHPLIGTATYLSDAGAPLMVFSQPTLQMSEDGPLYHEPRLRRRQSDAFVAFPQKALHVAFSGQLLHGLAPSSAHWLGTLRSRAHRTRWPPAQQQPRAFFVFPSEAGQRNSFTSHDLTFFSPQMCSSQSEQAWTQRLPVMKNRRMTCGLKKYVDVEGLRCYGLAFGI
ncbi:unnamed protein product [Durusdinium trenchii]|uniref:Uncharacterized protein n=1 Tax=Durusdinium trenchii TaxID=1381693 RepID=A0ABP0HSR7_9DINO